MSLKIMPIVFPMQEKFSVPMPEGAEILSLQRNESTNNPCLWVLADPSSPQVERHFELFRDNQVIPTDMGIDREYIGTYQYQRGEVIAHFFERIN